MSHYIWNDKRARYENRDDPDDFVFTRAEVLALGGKYLQQINERQFNAGGPMVIGVEKTYTEPRIGSGEVRTTSATGGEKGVKAEAYALLPSEALDEIARVYDFGARKYAAHNWRKGYEWSKSFSACMRHLWAWWRGENNDPESGLSHLAHAGFHVLGMLTFALNRAKYGNFDDRYKDE